MSLSQQASRQNAHVPDLVPARMLNEFAYCPRLAYLEWVQKEFTDNLDTIEGRFDHRRVDQPSSRTAPEGDKTADQADSDAPETIHTRSTLLSAPGEGLIARIDLLELNAATAVPVDYKHGKIPNVPGNAWEPEQVQLCAQGLILRENGYHCEGGVLYFVESRRRVSVPLTEQLVERTRTLLQELRATAASGRIPPPLDDSPKCPRCSLVGVCLPDETRLLEAPPDEANTEVRRLVPARDDALPLYVLEQGASVCKRGDRVLVKKSGSTLKQLRMIDVSQVSLFGNAYVTAPALRELALAGIPLCHFSYGGWFCALTSGLIHKNVELRQQQFATAADPQLSLPLSRNFVVGKITNARTLLRRHLKDDPDGVLGDLKALAERAENASSAPSLLGIEGQAAKLYFAGFAQLIEGGDAFRFEDRNRRPPRDPVNAMLSFVYALLVKELTIILHAVGFDPMLGFYHQPRYGRPSLALDLAEPFRPLIADSVVLTLVNNAEVTPREFQRRAGAVVLSDAGRRAVIAAYERRMDTLATHPLFGYKISYRRILEVQARLLARTVTGEIAQYPNFCTR